MAESIEVQKVTIHGHQRAFVKMGSGPAVLLLHGLGCDHTTWEREPMERLAREGEMSAYKHTGFWQPMDTLRDKNYLEELIQAGKAPWYNVFQNQPVNA